MNMKRQFPEMIAHCPARFRIFSAPTGTPSTRIDGERELYARAVGRRSMDAAVSLIALDGSRVPSSLRRS